MIQAEKSDWSPNHTGPKGTTLDGKVEKLCSFVDSC
jgi:hypothetical protein